MHNNELQKFELDKHICIYPMGGLGNQLFIYALGRELAKNNSCGLVIDATWFAGQNKRVFELNPLIQLAPPLSIHVSQTPSAVYSKFSLSRAGVFLGRQGLGTRNFFVEKKFTFDEKVLHRGAGSKLFGYFQSGSYFEGVKSDLQLEFADLMSDAVRTFVSIFSDHHAKNWVAVHIRRGDYIHSATNQYHGILDTEYYRAALDLMAAEIGDFTPVIFSDDTTAARELMSGLSSDFVFAPPRESLSDLETMMLMSQANGVVTANSSFSWWAGWIGNSSQRPVICPSKWFGPKGPKLHSLFMPNWKPV